MPSNTIILLPTTPSPFTVRLVLASSSGSSADPFEKVGETSDSSRTYRAQLVARTGTIVDELVVKLPPVAPWYDEDDEPLTHRDLEARWSARRRDMMRLQETPEAFLELLLPAESGDDSAPLRLPALLYCSSAQQLFRPICLDCLQPLATCRDDGLLARYELPLYSTTDHALLFCPSCVVQKDSEQDSRPLFVAPRGVRFELPDNGCMVLELPDYMQRLAVTLSEASEPQSTTTTSGAIPCAACSEAPACCGTPKGSKMSSKWHVFLDAETPYLLTRRAELGFDALVDSIGGADDRHERRLFSDSGTGLDAVEVLLLKNRLLQQVVRALRESYRLLGLPHLDLNPSHLVGDSGRRSSDGLPRQWQWQVRLLGGSSARLRTLSDQVQVVVPPRRPEAPFYSPRVRDFLLTSSRSGQLVLDRVVHDGDTGRCRFEARLSDPHGVFPQPTTDDWISLGWHEDPIGLGVRSIVARVDPRAARKRSAQLPLTTEPVAIETEVAKRLERVRGATIPAVRYRVYPVFGLREDLYSLGVVFLRVLLVNDRQDLAVIEEILTHLSSVEIDEIGPGDDLVSVTMSAFPEVLSKTQLFFRDLDRQANRPNAIPDSVWKDTVHLAFSVLTGEDASEDTNPTTYLDTVSARLQRLEQVLRSILFDRQPGHLQVRSVIAELLAEEQRRHKPS